VAEPQTAYLHTIKKSLSLERIGLNAVLGLLNQLGKFFQNLRCFLRMTGRLGTAVLSTGDVPANARILCDKDVVYGAAIK
jgi:hypothetical protein